MKQNVAVYLDSVDPLFLSKKYQSQSYIIVADNTPLYSFATTIFSEDRLLPVPMVSPDGKYYSERQILYSDTLLDLFGRYHITHLVIPATCSRTMRDWAKKYNIGLIGTPYNNDVNFENKRDFDAFLKLHDISSPARLDLDDLPDHSLYVVQEVTSSGLEGTRLYRSKEAVKKVLFGKQVQDFLIREYLNGTPIGATIFIDQKGQYFFSSLRIQCFSYTDSFPDTFLGIQWLPTNFFSEKLTESIYDILSELAKAFITASYKGIFNIDMIIHQGKPFVLECNPRLSAATAQVFSVPELTSFSDPYGFFLNSFLSTHNPYPSIRIPSSMYSGSLLALTVQDVKQVRALPSIGVYTLVNGTLRFLPGKTKITDFSNEIFMLHYLQHPGTYKKHTEVCSMLTHMSLFDLASGTLNSTGQLVFNFFQQAFFGQF